MCWVIDDYWVDAETFEQAKVVFERYQKLKAYW